MKPLPTWLRKAARETVREGIFWGPVTFAIAMYAYLMFEVAAAGR